MTVFHFAPDGTLLGRIGQEGHGPGEFEIPGEVHFNPRGELVVLDIGSQRQIWFTPQGEFLRSEPIQTTLGDGRVTVRILDADRRREYLNEHCYLHRMLFFLGPEADELVRRGRMAPPTLLELVDEEAETVTGFGELRSHEDPILMSVLNRVHWALLDADRVVISWNHYPELGIYRLNGGVLERLISRRTAFRVNPNPTLEERVLTGPGGSNQITIIPVVDTVSLDVAVDRQHRIWVVTMLLDQEEKDRREDEDELTDMVRLEIFSPEGELLAGVPLEAFVDHIAFDPEGNLWLMDARYNMSVWKYRVIW